MWHSVLYGRMIMNEVSKRVQKAAVTWHDVSLRICPDR